MLSTSIHLTYSKQNLESLVNTNHRDRPEKEANEGFQPSYMSKKRTQSRMGLGP